MKKGITGFLSDNAVSFVGIIVITAFFTVATRGRLLSSGNMQAILDQIIPLIIGGLGMIFVVSQGSIDMSQGSLVALSGTLAIMASNQFGFAVLFPVALICGAAVGLFNGVVLSRFKVPSLMLTFAMLIALRALVALFTQGDTIFASPEILSVNDYPIKLSLFIGLVLVVGYLFEYTKVGYHCKAIGENEIVGTYTGVGVAKSKILAYILSGLMAGVVGVLTVARIGGVDPGMGNFFELQVMLALFIGGVPVNGGMQSRIYKLLIGAPTVAILDSGLILCGVGGELSEMIKGAVLLLVVFITLLPRAGSRKRTDFVKA